ncbi:extracellular solute-binding protein [Arsenicicoccus dermatophilus]|uniref:sugar ABC transporter substrate-binding protein n=1 Tax=Arsenicicoccus dermatophilus TaxID=1076331 RepID=UPI00391710B9
MSSSTLRRVAVAVITTSAVALSACTGGFVEQPATSAGPTTLRVLVAASSDVELAAVRRSVAGWATRTGSTVEVCAAARLTEELAKGFAGGAPPDLFYVEPAMLGTYARAGNLYAYGDQVADLPYLPALTRTFTYRGRLQCAPKDFSTLALVIDQERWEAAGLTAADLPRDWAQLRTVAARLTRDGAVGLVLAPELQRVGTFMAQAGGWVLSPDGGTLTISSPANVTALREIRGLLDAGHARLTTQVDAGWAGQALVERRAAMVIEGNWVRGALAKDAPGRRITVAELPAGPAGRGTVMFTTCWGVAAASPHRDAAVDLVRHLGSDAEQLAAAKAFGVMPSTTTAMRRHARQTPQDAAFVKGAAYGRGMPNLPGIAAVVDELNAHLQTLPTTEAGVLLRAAQRMAEPALQE